MKSCDGDLNLSSNKSKVDTHYLKWCLTVDDLPQTLSHLCSLVFLVLNRFVPTPWRLFSQISAPNQERNAME